MKRELNPRQKRFVAEYLHDENATKAAQRAGYNCSGHAAQQRGYELLQNPLIKAALAVAHQRRLLRIELNSDWVLLRMMRQAEGAPKNADRIRALELLGKHLKLWTDKVELSGGLTLAQLVPKAKVTP